MLGTIALPNPKLTAFLQGYLGFITPIVCVLIMQPRLLPTLRHFPEYELLYSQREQIDQKGCCHNAGILLVLCLL